MGNEPGPVFVSPVPDPPSFSLNSRSPLFAAHRFGDADRPSLIIAKLSKGFNDFTFSDNRERSNRVGKIGEKFEEVSSYITSVSTEQASGQ